MKSAFSTPVTRFSRQDLARILRLPEKQIIAWQKKDLLAEAEWYSFADLARVRHLRELHAQRMSPRRVRESIAAMQKVAGMGDPLRETTAMRHGSRVVFRHSGALLDPRTSQLGFDFDGGGTQLMAKNPKGSTGPRREMEEAIRVQEIFLQAVSLEENHATVGRAAELYLEVLGLQPRHAAASINLGTIYYNQHRYAEAEQRYRYATEVDPSYALAFFDLGNVLDELQQLSEAVVAYQRAIHLVPDYADAHYNLALSYERQGQGRRALRHWLTYVRLDPVGPWASHARQQAKKILAAEKLRIVCRRGQAAS